MRIIHEYDDGERVRTHGPYRTDALVRRQCVRIVSRGNKPRVRVYKLPTENAPTTAELVVDAVWVGACAAAGGAIVWILSMIGR